MKTIFLPWDTEFFGIKIAKIDVDSYDKKAIESSVNSALSEGTDLIYLVIPDKIDKKEIFQKNLIDQKVIFRKTLEFLHEKNESVVEYNDRTVDPKLYEIALESGKYSRFRLDPMLPYGSYEKLYRIWIEKSAKKNIADSVLVYSENNEILGMITVKIIEDRGEIGLLAADYKAQGKGIGSKLICASENFAISRDRNVMEVATQLRNKAACSFYEKNGYSIDRIFNYYHIWKN
ncbi:MAG TPA: GNAT family N-acetyltransferase [Clostridiales bacterium]|nr:GNAT family N-acetyltransferase [Clostridiales bacterium]